MLVYKVNNIEKYFTVDWTVGSTCNFSCSYCPEELHNGKTTWLDIKNLKKFLDKIYKFTELPLHFILAGGEITVDPELKEKFYLITLLFFYFYGLVAWHGNTRYFVPCLIYLSFYFSFGLKFYKKLICHSPTTAGKGVKGFDGFISYAEKMSPLGNASALDCANYTVSLFSDLTRKVTLQNLFHDGGFSNMGVSDAVMQVFEEE